MQVKCVFYRSSVASWETLFAQAADFASELPEDRLINISHSESHSAEGVVAVWFWADADDEGPTAQQGG